MRPRNYGTDGSEVLVGIGSGLMAVLDNHQDAVRAVQDHGSQDLGGFRANVVVRSGVDVAENAVQRLVVHGAFDHAGDFTATEKPGARPLGFGKSR